MKIEKKHIVVCCSLIILLIVSSVLWTASTRWISFDSIDYCANLSEETILEISLKKTADAVKGVVFSDEDLISEWSNCFANLEMKREFSPSFLRKKIDGGKPTITVKTDKATYSFLLLTSDGYKIQIGKKIYLIKNPQTIPFIHTYDEAASRYGIISFGK